ncbi:11830_t:CDS:2 [Acaulospora colombiana]|uniref:11830_t:CDS:1 n=1 Tax=Acaulospora colombiana TaxID=27376 RepID=A0ACA9K6R8_9GLOM|nr:11830_t:CDS:2 [Acaulospora colombiana]
MSGITDAERQNYYQVFTSLGPSHTGHLSGAQAMSWLLSSKLPVPLLERIWDICDIDKDGQLDFDEFLVTSKLVSDLLARVYTDVPSSLPPHLIPPSKVHLLAASGFGGNSSTLGIVGHGMYSRSISPNPQTINPIPQSISPIPQTNIGPIQSGMSNIVPSYQLSQNLPQITSVPSLSSQSSYGSFPAAPLSDDFDWYMPPADKFNYENEYSKKAGLHGYVRCESFEKTWYSGRNLTDVNFEQQLGKDQCLVFLHVLNQRSKGKRIPDSVPSALKTSLVRGRLNYNYNETVDPSWKSKSSDSDSQSSIGGTYGSSAEDASLSSSSGDSGVASEFKQLCEYKQRQLTEEQDKEQLNRMLEEYIRKERLAIRELQDGLQSLKSLISTIENNSESREADYRRLQRDIEDARLGR